jgi:hypothetical protein
MEHTAKLPLPVYKATVEQIGNSHRCSIKRRRVEAFRKAQIGRIRARNAARRLDSAIRYGHVVADRTILGVLKHLRRQGDTRVVGPNWRSPRPGRRS